MANLFVVFLIAAARASDPGDGALDLIREEGPRLGIPEGTEFEVVGSSFWHGRERVLLGQLHEGVPVLGAGARVEVLPDGSSGLVVPSLRGPFDVDPRPRVSRDAAASRVPTGRSGTVFGERLVVVPDGAGGALAWELGLRGGLPTEARRALVDAHDGRVLYFGPEGAHALGQVFATKAEEDDLAIVELRDIEPGADTLLGKHVESGSVAFDEEGRASWVQHATADESGDFLYDPDHPDPADGFVEVNTYHHAAESRAFFDETFGHPVPRKVTIYANYMTSPGEAYENAFFSYDSRGQYVLTFGQGAEMDWGYDPGIVIHEFSHGIVEDVTHLLQNSSYPVNIDEYGLNPAPGGLTEGLPDYWSVTRTGRSAQGSYADGTPIRDLENDATCPEDVLGEAHADGEIIGGATWELREALGATATDEIVYGAMGLLGPSPTYAEFGAALVSAAQTLAAEGALSSEGVDVVASIADARGLLRCGRAIALSEGESSGGTFLGADIIDESFCSFVRSAGIRITTPFQYSVAIPEAEGWTARALALDLTLEPATPGAFEEGDVDYVVYASGSGLVEYELEELTVMGYTVPLPQDPVNALFEFPGNPARVEIEARSLGLDHLPPGSEWTFSIAGLNCRTAIYTVRPSIDWERTTTPALLRGCTGLADRRAFLVLPIAALGLRRRARARVS